MAEVKKVGLDIALGGVECYSKNIAELAKDLKEEVVLDASGKIVIDFKGGVNLAQIVWDAAKASIFECAGKELQINPPSGVVGSVINFALSFIGFKL